ncbi:ankyrin repeat-containing domain protein [Aspergillus avenaceus]|uniref:Ankyrin repeat-containing domain protein n=1 Tax=Aspergillus avenaceus TaxID=36643 RepID=A0A5N6U290_ASPAV|nr:ankyrin repeat-containing domain protein [Aspergillus avenaceus]
MASRELTLAIDDGKPLEVKRLLDSGIPLKMEQFLLAISFKNLAILETILSSGWDINTEVNGYIPSALAHTFDDEELLNWFLTHGANPNKSCRIRDCTPLSYAVKEASFGIIQRLVQYGGQSTQGQLLHYASMREDEDGYDILRFIYNLNPEFNGLQINKLLDEESQYYLMYQRSGHCTPLQYAAINGSEEMVQFLLDRGANPGCMDSYRRTAISYAVRYHHEKVTGILKRWMDSVQT